MPRTNILTNQQIETFLTLTADETNETFQAVRLFLLAELSRRVKAGKLGGRKKTVADKKEANRKYQQKWRNKKNKNNT